eukprot:scaffold589715_cov19-Prasinocladus_malaysianus.AAC.1
MQQSASNGDAIQPIASDDCYQYIVYLTHSPFSDENEVQWFVGKATARLSDTSCSDYANSHVSGLSTH